MTFNFKRHPKVRALEGLVTRYALEYLSPGNWSTEGYYLDVEEAKTRALAMKRKCRIVEISRRVVMITEGEE